MSMRKIKVGIVNVVGVAGLLSIAFGLILGVILIVPFLVMAFWNDVMVALYGGIEITLWQSFLITLMFLVVMSITNAIIQFFRK